MTSDKKTSTASTSHSAASLLASSLGSVLLLAVILVAINYISGIAFLRADMTAEKLFTLSEGTRSMLGRLSDKTRLKFYFSRSLANVPFGYKLYGKRIEEFLGEYVASSRGMIELEVLDPQPDSDVEEWAVKYGLAQAGLPTGEKFYLGLVSIVADKEEVIPFFTVEREEFLEYDITRAIVQASARGKATVGVLSPLPVIGASAMPVPGMQQGEDWLFLRELRKNFDIRKIETNVTEISGDVSLLMVIHPKDLPESTLYAIDQFVLKGGRAIVMVDPACMADNLADQSNPFMAMMNRASDLPKLLKNWGVEYNRGKIAADINMATRVNAGPQGVIDHPLWLSMSGDAFNRESAVSAKLNSMLMVNAGVLSKVSGSANEFVPLLMTRESGNQVDTHQLLVQPAELVRSLPTSGSRQTLAALVRGTFSSAFTEPPTQSAPDGESEEAKKQREAKTEQRRKNHVAKAEKPGSVMVIADVDLLQNDYCVRAINFFGNTMLQPLNDNLAFVSNCVDLLAGSEDLIAVRSRGKFTRPFTRVENIEREAQKRWQEEEKTLTARLEAVQQRINQLQSQKKDGERLILSAAQREEIERARTEQSETMRRRREIRKLLRQDIESLGAWVTFINLLLMPLMVAAAGVYVYMRQNSRRGML
ncbi:MAG: Gldg family protein [Candidatus Riflebacteria bacterium]|nr:Gldg family protein [Candidatus Riflebacteria bacterium]